MKDLTPAIRTITSKYGKEFIANDDFLDVLKSKFSKKDVELNQKLFAYTVLRDEKVLSRLITMQKKDIPKYIECEISSLSANYGLEENIIRTVFKELLVGSGIAQERKDVEVNDNEKTTIPKSSLRLRNRLSKSKSEINKIDKRAVYCVLSIFWAAFCLIFLPLIPASMKDEFDIPGIIPSIILYAMSVTPLLFILTSNKQSQTLKSVAGGALVCVGLFAGLFFSFGLGSFDYYYYSFLPDLSVIIVSMLISLLVSWLTIFVFFLIKEQEFSKIIKLFRQNKRIFLSSFTVSTILVIIVGFLVLKYGVIELLVGFMGEFVANVCMWVMLVLVAIVVLFAYS